MENEKSTGLQGEFITKDNHLLCVTDAAMEACHDELRKFLEVHGWFNHLPGAFTTQAYEKVMIETTEDGSATFVFLPVERDEVVAGRKMRELNDQTVLA